MLWAYIIFRIFSPACILTNILSAKNQVNNWSSSQIISVNRLTTRIRISCSDPVLSWVRIRMRQDFFSVKWDRTRFFFDEMRQNQIFFDEMRQNQTFFWWDETESDSFFVRWDRIRLLFDEMRQNRIRMRQNFLILTYIRMIMRNDNDFIFFHSF